MVRLRKLEAVVKPFIFVPICCIFDNFPVSDAGSAVGSGIKSSRSNSTTCELRQTQSSKQSPTIGFVAAFIAVLMFGSNFVPVKKIKTGDGIFFQWIVCLGIWFVGLIVHLSNGEDRKFYPIVLIGGAIWCSGNMCVVPIIKTIGLAMGLLVWGILNLLGGWATGRFGAFGLICEQHVKNSALNYVGVVLAIISLGIFVFIKTEESSRGQAENSGGESESGDQNKQSVQSEENHTEEAYLLPSMADKTADVSWIDRLPNNQKRFVGIFLSIVSGFLYGISFVPMYAVQKSNKHAPDDGLQYVFSQFTGILMTSSVYFLVYCIYKKNKPDLFPVAVAPGFLSGVLWAIGAVAWFVANTKLSEPVSFPIVTTGPGVVASIWGVFIFKEIKGMSNFIALGVAFCFVVSGAVVTGYSK